MRHQSISCLAARLWHLIFCEQEIETSNISCQQPCHVRSYFFRVPSIFTILLALRLRNLANIVLCSYNLGFLSEHALDAAVGLMLHGEVVILYRCFFCVFPNILFISYFFQPLGSVCEHKCGWLTIEDYKAVQISYSQKFPYKMGVESCLGQHHDLQVILVLCGRILTDVLESPIKHLATKELLGGR